MVWLAWGQASGLLIESEGDRYLLGIGVNLAQVAPSLPRPHDPMAGLCAIVSAQPLAESTVVLVLPSGARGA